MAWLDRDIAAHAREAGPGSLIAAVAGTPDGFGTAEGGVQPGVVGADVQACQRGGEARLHALPPRLAEILEVAVARGVVGHEQDVVLVIGAKDTQVPSHGAGAGAVRKVATHARFQRAGHHLLERWVAGHRVGQLAGVGRVGAAQLHRRRRAAALVEAAIHRQALAGCPGQADGRIEAAEAVVTVQRAGATAGADGIAVFHRRAVVAARQREVAAWAQRQHLAGKQAGRAGARRQVDPGVVGLTVDMAAGHTVAEGPCAGDAVVGVDGAQLRALPELHPADIQRHAGHPLVRQAGQSALAVDLRREAEVRLRGVGSVDQPVAFLARFADQQHIGDAAPGRERRVAGVGARSGKAGVARGGERVLLVGIGLVDRLVQRVVIDVAVGGSGLDAPPVDIARQRQTVGQRVTGRQVQQRRSVLGGVGLAVDAGPVLGQQAALLQAVAVEIGVSQRSGQRPACLTGVVAELAEQLAHVAG